MRTRVKTLLGLLATLALALQLSIPALGDAVISTHSIFTFTRDQLYTTLTLSNVTVSGGAIIAPHLYNWYFNGLSYIQVPDNPSIEFTDNLTILTGIRWLLSSWSGVNLIVKRYSYALTVASSTYSDGFGFIVWSGGSQYAVYSSVKPSAGSYYDVAVTYANGTTSIYINTTLENSKALGAPVDVSGQPLTVAYEPIVNTYIEMQASYIILYNTTLSTNEVASTGKHVIYNTGELKLFLDPTFYNGTAYIDLSGNNNNAIPYGDVQCVEAESKWLWLVENATGDGLVHLRFFPYGSVVLFRNATTGEVVARVYINGTANPAGLVEDTAVSLPPGQYTVEAIIPRHVVLAPHLYDVYVPGSVTSYIVFYLEGLPEYVGGTLTAWLTPKHGSSALGWSDVVRLYDNAGGWLQMYYPNGYGALKFVIYNGTSSIYTQYQTQDGVEARISAYYTSQGIEVYSNGQLVATGAGSLNFPPRTPTKIIVAHNYRNNDLSYKLYFVGVWLNKKYIANSTVIERPDFFFDPTFYNGTVYLDLVNESVVGTPYGNVQRVPAVHRWVWAVVSPLDDRVNASVVDLEWFPAGTQVLVFDRNTGRLIKEVYIDHDMTAGEKISFELDPAVDWEIRIVLQPVLFKLTITSDDWPVRIQVYDRGMHLLYQCVALNTTNLFMDKGYTYVVEAETPDGLTHVKFLVDQESDVTWMLNSTRGWVRGLEQHPLSTLLRGLNTALYGWGLLMMHLTILAVLYVWLGGMLAGLAGLTLTFLWWMLARALGLATPMLPLVVAALASGAAVAMAVAAGGRGE